MKVLYNKCSTNQKFQQCKVRCVITGKQCANYTRFKYCKLHYKIYKEYCHLYHLYNRRDSYSTVPIHVLARVEYELRQNFEYMFNIECDYGHEKWKKFLKSKFEIVEKRRTVEYFQIDYDNLDLKRFDYLNLIVRNKKINFFRNNDFQKF